MVTQKLNNVESHAEAAQKTGEVEKESLQRQLKEAKRTIDGERQRHEVLLKDMEDNFVSFARDLFRSKR